MSGSFLKCHTISASICTKERVIKSPKSISPSSCTVVQREYLSSGCNVVDLTLAASFAVLNRSGMMGELPPELLDIVFAHLHPSDWDTSWDKSACGKFELDSCSRVSRSWNAAARSHLFRDVIYSFRPVPPSEVTTLNDDGEYSSIHDGYARFDRNYKHDARYKTLPMFHSFIQRSPLVQNSLLRLRLDLWQRTSSFYDDSDRADAEMFVSLLRLLPRLRVLHLYNFTVAHGPIRAPPLVHPSLKHVYISSESTIFCAVARNWPDLDVAAVLDCFTKCETLQLTLPGVPRFFSPMQEGVHPLEIDSLILGDSIYLDDGLEEYLFVNRHALNVRSLEMKLVSPDTNSELFSRFASSMKELEFVVPDIDDFGALSLLCRIRHAAHRLRHTSQYFRPFPTSLCVKIWNPSQ